ncbi:MAG: iron-containing alcohol dehydrogenase [Syntrophobacteraceae bacterium]
MQLPDFYEHYHPTKIIAGQRALSCLPFEMGRFGVKTPLVVVDEKIYEAGFVHLLEQAFADCGRKLAGVFSHGGRVCVETAQKISELFRRGGCDCFLTAGGGTAMDAAKAAALLIARNGGGLPSETHLSLAAPKIFSVPFTYAPGCQVSGLVELFDEENNRPLFYSSEDLIPRAAVLDPRATLAVTPSARAVYAMEALFRSVEAAVVPEANPVVSIHAKAAIGLLEKYLAPALTGKKSKREADQAMANASLYAGIAFSQRSCGIVAAAAHALRAVTGMEEGLAGAILLGPGLSFYSRSCAPQLADLAGAFAGLNRVLSAENRTAAVLEAVSALRDRTGLPQNLREAGVARVQLEEVAQAAKRGPFFSDSLFCDEDIFALLEKAFWGEPCSN